MPATPLLPSFRVLIVDDNPVCSNILARVIESQQLGEIVALHVNTLRSAEEALRDLETACYDIIFTDIEMRQVSGDEMVRRIHSGQTHPIHESNRGIPIIAITTKDDPDSRERYEDAGITKCLGKPVERESIYAIIEERVDQIKENRIK